MAQTLETPFRRGPHILRSTVTSAHFLQAYTAHSVGLPIPRAERESAALKKLEDYKGKVGIFAHNAASVDQKPEAFEHALAVPGVGIEIDTRVFKGELVAAHRSGSFRRYLRNNPQGIVEQNLDTIIAVSAGAGRVIHIDGKLTEDEHEYYPDLAAKENDIPEGIQIFNSSRNWRLLEFLDENVERGDVAMLFTVDGFLGNTLNHFYHRAGSATGKHPLGVSIHPSQATRKRIRSFNESGFYSLVYPINRATSALRYIDMGVSGIATDNKKIFSALGNDPGVKNVVFQS